MASGWITKYGGVAGWLSVVLTGLTFISSDEALAAEWGLTPSVNTQVFYDDNLLLGTQNKIGTWGSVVSASLALSRKMENTSLIFTDRIAARHYDNYDTPDTNDNYMNLSYGYNAERYSLSLNGGYSRESTITSELDDTGRVQVVRKVNQTTLAPSFNYQISPRSSLSVSLSHQEKNYDAPITEFSDYTVDVVNANYSYAVSESTRLQAVLTRSKVDTPDGAFRFVGVGTLSQTDNYQLGLEYQLAENLNISALYGKRDTQQDIEVNGSLFATETSQGSVYNIAVTKTLARGTLKLQATRDYSPSGNGVVYETDNANLNMQLMLDQRHGLNLDIAYLDRKASSTTFTAIGRKYYRIQPGYYWNMSENWVLSTYYRYSRQQYDDNTAAAESNLVSINLAYSWPYYRF